MTRLVLLIAVLMGTAGPLARQQPTFSSKRESVRIDVLVTERGRPVRGLTAADFEIRDSGVLQQIDFVSFGELPLNLVLALDGSSSVSPEQLAHLREGGKAALETLESDDQAALLTFADGVTLRQRLTTDFARVRTALDGMQHAAGDSGGTALIDACYTALMLPEADAGRTLLIAFTDGLDTSSWLGADGVLQAARRSNVVTYAVSTSRLPDASLLRDLSELTGGAAIEVASTADLRATFLRIVEEFRQRYLVGYSPNGVPNDGWHPLIVRVKGRNVDVRARAGYTK